ncbi:MAG: ATP-binding protein [Steroidobacter sp.]
MSIAPQSSSSARPNILVVEDERVVAMDLVGTLRELGYGVAGTAARAHDAVRQASELKPDLILMDVRLAGEPMDGIEVARVIRSGRDVPIIYLTAHSDTDTLRRACGTAASGYLVKPFKTPELRCAIEIALHKHAADHLVQDRERWLTATLHSVADAVVATDENGHVRLFNTVAETMTGWSAQDACKQPAVNLLSLVDERSGEPLGDVVERVLMTKDICQCGSDTSLISRSGRHTPVEGRATPIIGEHGEVYGVVWALHDVTERRQQLEQIHRLNEDLERRVQQRTAALESANRELESFSYSVAHDLRSPLRAITAFSELLGSEHTSQLDSAGLRYLERIASGVKRMSDLIDALLALSCVGRRALSFTCIDICELARSIGADIALGRTGLPVQFTVEGSTAVTTDAALLHLILSNLLGNAFKFTMQRTAPQVHFGACQVRRQEAFYVRDNGAGFDPRYTGKLFEPFQRLHDQSEFPGTGIGLAIVARAVQRLGGSIWAESQPNKGATFYFTLPPQPPDQP